MGQERRSFNQLNRRVASKTIRCMPAQNADQASAVSRRLRHSMQVVLGPGRLANGLDQPIAVVLFFSQV